MHPSKQSTSADVSLTSVQRQFNAALTLDWRKTDIRQRRLFTGIKRLSSQHDNISI